MQSTVRYQTNRVSPIDHTAFQNEVKLSEMENIAFQFAKKKKTFRYASLKAIS